MYLYRQTDIHRHIHLMHASIHTCNAYICYMHNTYLRTGMPACLPTYIHTCIHPYIHTYTHAIHACIYIYTHTPSSIHMYIHTYILTYACFPAEDLITTLSRSVTPMNAERGPPSPSVSKLQSEPLPRKSSLQGHGRACLYMERVPPATLGPE